MADLSASRRSRRFSRNDDRSLDVYLKEIGKTPLLKREEEVELARRIKQGDDKALDQMVRANLRFVVSLAKQYQNQGMHLSDLINEGNLGLIKAAKRFDETRGFKFISYAVWWIRQAILQALAEQSRIVRLPLNRVGTLHKISKAATAIEQKEGRKARPDEIAKRLEISDEDVRHTLEISPTYLSLDAPFIPGEENTLMDVLEDKASPSAEQVMIDESLCLEIKKALDSIKKREAEVITLYFGLNGEKSLTLEEIGVRYSLTRERIRQIKEKAIRRLRHASRSKSLRAFLDDGDGC